MAGVVPRAAPGGVLLTGFMNPDLFIFDVAALDERGELVVRHPLPFSTLDLPEAERHAATGTARSSTATR